MAQSPIRRLTFWLQALLALNAVLIFGGAFDQFHPQVLLQNALAWVNDLGASGVLIFILLYNLATIFFIPGSVLTLGGGMLYGVIWGSIYVVVASVLGAIFAFLIGRYWARDWVCQQLKQYPQFRAIDTAVARRGTRIVFLTRLSPVFPFNLLNYAFGVTTIPLKDYLLGSIGMVPGTVMYVYIGSLVGDMAALGESPDVGLQAQVLQWTMRGIGLIATITVTVYMAHLARKALQQDLSS
jgi:uncharacterized membrane protein YdjX (TVP38/TMEM64 family)